MHEFELIKNYFQKLSKKSQGALNLNDDVFFDKFNLEKVFLLPEAEIK